MNELQEELDAATDSLIIRWCEIFEKHVYMYDLTWESLSLIVDSNLPASYSDKVLVRSRLAEKYGITLHSATQEQAGA